jgi:hypothetical protein
MEKSVSRRPYLLFSSVGDSYDKAVESWSQGHRRASTRNYDIVLVYYGENPARFSYLAALADRVFWSRGSKFQNLVRHLDAVAALEYRYVWVVDDDIALKPRAISRLFHIAEQYRIAAAQPAFLSRGLISHPATARRGDWVLLHYTNFVEVTCPVLSQDALRILVGVIRPHMDLLTCWGIDILLAYHVWKPDAPFAVIDAISVCNPHQREKRGGRRECERMDSIGQLRARWLAVRERMADEALPAEAQFGEFPCVWRWPLRVPVLCWRLLKRHFLKAGEKASAPDMNSSA